MFQFSAFVTTDASTSRTFLRKLVLPQQHFDRDAVEVIGLVKIDILTQGGLAVMRDAKQSLSERGIEFDLEQLEPWQDPEVW